MPDDDKINEINTLINNPAQNDAMSGVSTREYDHSREHKSTPQEYLLIDIPTVRPSLQKFVSQFYPETFLEFFFRY
ncbi:MAG: hypothetical protein ACJATU_001120 [Rickettsiales bacterium]|jgi:hypothetical protein